jgi:hypothetical protein
VCVFIQDPDPESDPDPGSEPKLSEKSDPDPKKIIPDPQHWKQFIWTSCCPQPSTPPGTISINEYVALAVYTLLQVFFMNRFPPSFLGFSIIRTDIRSSWCTDGVNDTGGKWEKYRILSEKF